MAGKRKLNPRRAKIHRSYTVEEAADLYGVHKRTVRNWIKAGLPCLSARRPHLIIGRELRDFLSRRRQRSRQPCEAGEIYCLPCRARRRPAGDMLDYIPITLVSGNLRGICPICNRLLHRRVSLAKVDLVRGRCAVAYPQGQQRLTDTSSPSSDCHSDTGAPPDEKAQ